MDRNSIAFCNAIERHFMQYAMMVYGIMPEFLFCIFIKKDYEKTVRASILLIIHDVYYTHEKKLNPEVKNA